MGPGRFSWKEAARALPLVMACAVASPVGLSGPAAAATVWSNINPGGGGAFTCIAAGPTGIIVAGSDISGAYYSLDHGGSWKNIGSLSGGIDKCYVSSAAFDNLNGWIVYLGTDGALYRSGDGARTFQVVYGGGYYSAIAVAPSNPNIVYAARQTFYYSTDPIILNSPNRGGYFQYVGSLPAGTRILKLGVCPNDPTRLFALSGYDKLSSSTPPRRALFVSNDSGVTWTDVHGDSTAGGMTGNPWDAAYDPIHPDTLFVTSVLGSNPDISSTWNGYTWRGRQSAPGVWTQVSAHTGSIQIRPDNGQIVTIDARRDGPACTECGVFRSSDWGGTWTRVSDMTGWDPGWNGSIAWAYNGSFSGQAKTLSSDPTNLNVIYWVTPQFVFRSTNGGASFSNMFTNPAAPGYWSGRGINNVATASVSASGNALYAGFYDIGIWRSFDNGSSWQASNDNAFTGSWGGKGGDCMTILADPARSNVVWASQGQDMLSANVIRSTTSAQPGAWTASAGITPGFLSGLSMDPTSPTSNRTLYVTANGELYRSTNDGQSWSMIFQRDSCYVTAASGNRIFAGGACGLWRSLDGGTTWTELAASTFHQSATGFSLEQGKWNGPHRILMAGDTVYVANYGHLRGLYRSIDVGNTWTRILADEFAMEVRLDAYGNLYMGSSSATSAGGIGSSGATGIQVSRDLGATWSNLTSGLTWPFVGSIETVPLGGGSVRLFVASSGSGFWTTVTVPFNPVGVGPDLRGPQLDLAGFQPNPARDHVSIAFSLASQEPAVLEVFDLAGRRVARRDVGWMGAGSHVLELGQAFRPAPGIYSIRLVQGSRSIHTRSVVIR